MLFPVVLFTVLRSWGLWAVLFCSIQCLLCGMLWSWWLRLKLAALVQNLWFSPVVALACSRHSDCRDDTKRCEHEKQQGLGRQAFPPLSLFLASSFFPHPLTSLCTALSECPEKAMIALVLFFSYGKVLFFSHTFRYKTACSQAWIILVWAFRVILGWRLGFQEHFLHRSTTSFMGI